MDVPVIMQQPEFLQSFFEKVEMAQIQMDKAYWPRCLLWHGWLPMLSGLVVPLLGLLMLLRVLSIYLRCLLGATHQGSSLSGVSMRMRLLLGCRMSLRCERMVVLSQIRSLVCLLLVLVSLLTSRSAAGAAAGGAMLIRFSLTVQLTSGC